MTDEDAIRNVLAEHGADWRTPADHKLRLSRAITKSRQRRLAGATAVAAIAFAGATAAGIAVTHHPGQDRQPVLSAAAVPPAVSPSPQQPTPSPSPQQPFPSASPPQPSPSGSGRGNPAEATLPLHMKGEHLVASKAGTISPNHSTLTLQFTPTTWDFSIAAICQTNLTQQLEVIIDHGAQPYFILQCGQQATFGGLPDTPPANDVSSRGWWQSQGRHVQLHRPITITIKVGKETLVGNVIRSGVATTTGTAAVGVYLPH